VVHAAEAPRPPTRAAEQKGTPVTLVADIDAIKSADIDYVIAQNYHDGKNLPELFSNKAVAKLLGKAAENYRVNIAAKGVTGITNKLVLEGWKVTRDGERDEVLEELFRVSVWDRNKLDAVVPDALQAATIQGDAYLLGWPDEDEGSDGVDCFLHKAIGARMFYEDENEQIKRAYVRTWLVRGPGSDADQKTWFRRVNEFTHVEIDSVGYVVVRKLISTVKAIEVKHDSQFTEFADEDPEDREDTLPPGESMTPMEQLPVFHLRNARPYGVPDHECLYGCQNLLIKTITTLAESVDGFGLPWRFRTMDPTAQLGAGADRFDDEDDEDDAVSAKAGELSNLYGTASVGQLMPADVNNLLEPIDKVFDIAAEVSSVPMSYIHASGADASGVSKREHKSEYHAKVRKRRRDLGDELVAFLEFCLSLASDEDTDELTVELLWEPLEELSALERYEQITAGLAAGLPWKQACVEAGYDAEVVDEWIRLGLDPDNSLDARASRFEKLARGTQALASAMSLGGLDAGVVVELVQQAIAPVGGDEG
jgi:hypothetical protein